MNDEQHDPQQPEAESRQHEAWAEQKGMLPQFAHERVAPLGAQRANPQYWKYAAARAHRRWTDGQLVTEADFDAAVDEAANQITR